jgi:hypothetical protein
MSTPVIPVVSKSGDVATGVPLKGGAIALMPAPVGGRRRGSKKMTKKMKKMLKALKMMKGGALDEVEEIPDTIEEGGRRRNGSKKTRRGRRSSKGFFA